MRDTDVGDLCRMHRDSTVMATLGGVRSTEQTQEFLHANLAHWDEHGYGLWIFRDKANDHFAGRGGLRQVAIGAKRENELAYALMLEF